MELIKTQDLHKSYGNLEVLTGITETIHRGEVVSIIGPSGGGKSTFLRCLNMLEVPQQGKIYFQGTEITGNLTLEERSAIRQGKQPRPAKANPDLYRRQMGMVFQHFNIFPHLTVEENITLAPRMLRGKSKSEASHMARELLKQVGLLDKRQEMPENLSGGQKQRLAIVRALAMEPQVMLFDEPTSALDPEMVGEVLEVIRGLVATGLTSVIVTHEMRFAEEISHRVLFMAEGKILEQGSPRELFHHPRHPRLQEFLKKVL